MTSHEPTKPMLADLIAIFAARWRVIVVAIATSLVAGLALLIVLPALGADLLRGPFRYRAHVDLPLAGLPPEARAALDFEVPEHALFILRSAEALEAAAVRAGIARDVLGEQPTSRLGVAFDTRRNTIVVDFLGDDEQLIGSLVSAHVAIAYERMRERIVRELSLERQSLATQIERVSEVLARRVAERTGVGDDLSREIVVDALTRPDSEQLLLYLRVTLADLAIEQALSSPSVPFWPPPTVAIEPTRRPPLLRDNVVGMSLFAALGFLAGVMLAFILDYVAWVRKRVAP